MKAYSKSGIKDCSERVFGIIHKYDKYDIKYFYSDSNCELKETTNLSMNNLHIRIIGNDRIKKDKLYMSVNEYDFFFEVKSIGKKLFNLLELEINNIIDNDNQFLSINLSIINNKAILNNITAIHNIILPFLKKYGLPVDYDSISNSLNNENNSIDLGTLCSYFIILHVVSDLAGHYNKGHYIEHLYKIVGISSTIERNKLISELLNYEYLSHLHLEKYQIKYIDNYPINCTDNLFSFAYERLKMNIIEKESNHDIIARTSSKGIPISRKNNKGKNARMVQRKVPLDPEKLKEYNALKQGKAHDNLVKEFNRIKNMASYIEKYDYDFEYDDIINTANSIKNVSHYKRKDYPTLHEDLRKAYSKLKRKNDRQ